MIVPEGAGYPPEFLRDSLATLARCSESRGKDTSGLVFRDTCQREFQILKGPVSLKRLLKMTEVEQRITKAVAAATSANGSRSAFAMMGHTRLVTNGSQANDFNNQPVVKDGVIGIHNGIIVNDGEIWSQHPEIQRAYEIDTEALLALVGRYLREDHDLAAAVSRAISEARGTVAAGFFVDAADVFAAATNNGSLYILTNGKDLFAFASEEYFLRRYAKKFALEATCDIEQVHAGTGVIVDLRRFGLKKFAFTTSAHVHAGGADGRLPYRVVAKSLSDGRQHQDLVLDPAKLAVRPRASIEAALLQFNFDRIQAIRRCTACVLPETFPFIDFDPSGVCNYCRHYKIKNRARPIEDLQELVAPYRRSDGHVDCIIPFSGGRDSTLTVHIAKKILGLNPVTFTYDWGMVNDLARRNIARVCGQLGVENILVSADISWKRANIRKNVLAWLKKPHLGMVPLFMAGDKFFFYYCDQVKKQTGVRLNIWGINPLENTDFKVGLLGVPPDHDKKRIYSLSAKRQAQLFWSVAVRIATNPSYVNSTVWDTFGSFVSRSMVPHRDYYHMFDYYRWDEAEIERLVLQEYGWETAIDTPTTWRIGDGTAPFYNYIYYTVAGFSEYDTFRSNQIREGMLTRDQAMAIVAVENRPRYPSIKWYTDILNLDFESTIRRINDIPKLYP